MICFSHDDCPIHADRIDILALEELLDCEGKVIRTGHMQRRTYNSAQPLRSSIPFSPHTVRHFTIEICNHETESGEIRLCTGLYSSGLFPPLSFPLSGIQRQCLLALK